MKFSIIIPIYNVEKYIQKCLDSVSNQTYDDFEAICVNDGTLDNSIDFVNDMIKNDNRFKLFNKKNGGLSDARNYGIAKAKGDYFVFLDSDDFLESDLLMELSNEIDNSNADCIIYDFYQYVMVDNSKQIIKNKFLQGNNYNLKENKNLLSLMNNCAWNKCYKSSLFIVNDLQYPVGYLYEDLGLTYRLLYYSNSVRFINKPLINYLIDRPGNISTNISKRIFDVIDMCQLNVDFFKDKNEFDIYYQELECLCKANIVDNLRKVVCSNDKKMAIKFINQSFKFMKDTFCKKTKSIYSFNSKSDIVYKHKYLCILYVYWKRGIAND